jgi:restriction endonuclease S subunit
MKWKKIKLGEVLKESRIPSENPNPDRRITVRLNVLGVEKRPLEKEKSGATKQFIRKAGQFIYGKQNFHKGAFGIIPNELDGFESSADLPSFDVREDCLPEWIFYFFKQGGFYLELAKIARGVATQRIHPEQIYDLEIPLPDIETQKNIIASIKAIEEKGEKLNKQLSHQLTLLDQLNQAILQEAVQGKLVPQDPNDEPASELLKRTLALSLSKGKPKKTLPPIKPEEIPFDIPKNWVWCRLGEICEVLGGFAFDSTRYSKVETQNQVIRLGNVKPNRLVLESSPVYIDDEFAQEVEKSILKEKDILITMTGTKAKRDYLFTLCLSADDLSKKRLFLNQRVGCFRFDSFIFPDYINFALKDLNLLSPVFDSSTGAANQANIGMTSLKAILIPLPPLSEQKRIVAEIERQFAKTKQLKEYILSNQAATEQLLKALLHQAFLPAAAATQAGEIKENEENLAKA